MSDNEIRVAIATMCWKCAERRRRTADYLASSFGVFAGMGSNCDFCGKDNGGRQVQMKGKP